MERAGNEDYDEDTEKKGLGTPATRAATIESLVKNGYVERVGKQLRATDRGKELVKVVPDEVKSAKLTAEWESKLQQIEHGSLPETVFMSGIQQFIADMCRKYGSVDKSVSLSDGGHEPIGKCPKCGADVVKGKFGWYCKGKCGMNIAKVYGISLSDAQIKGLLDGKSTSYTSKGKIILISLWRSWTSSVLLKLRLIRQNGLSMIFAKRNTVKVLILMICTMSVLRLPR